MKILVTGGTGSLGRALVLRLAREHEVTILSRDAHKQENLRLKLLEQRLAARFVLGDICDPVAQLNACIGQEVIIHAAALKRIERGETDPDEYIRVNVRGAQEIARRAVECGVSKALLICTDKATAPLNCYGITKALAERAWIKAQRPWASTKFAAIRYGNVIDSDGAVKYLWTKMISEGKRLTVRAPEPTRFVLTVDQALGLVVEALDHLAGNEVLVPRALPAISMWDMARAYQPEYLWHREPLTPGEKQHEVLLAEGEYAYPFSEHLASISTDNHAGALPRSQFASNTTRRLDSHEIHELLGLKEEGYELSDYSRVREQLVAA